MPAPDSRTLHLLRHAKSAWDEPGRPDIDRPLSPRGRRAAGQLADHVRAEGIAPTLVICSPARRTRETLAALRPVFGPEVEVRREVAVYGAGVRELTALLALAPPTLPSLLVIGHNPGLQELALELALPGPERSRIEAKLPTCALATLALAPGTAWDALAPGCATVAAYWTPAAADD